MAKEQAKKPTPKRGKYVGKLAVNGSFIDIMNAAAKHRNAHSAIPKNQDTKNDNDNPIQR